jgi:hypothetical protein
MSKLEMVKEMIRGYGLDPERVLVKDAMAEAHRGVVAGDLAERQTQILWRTLKENMLSELKSETANK